MSATIQVSMVANAYATKTTPVPLLPLLRKIKDGGWQGRQDVIRAKREQKLRETGGDLKAAKLEIKKDKEALPGALFAGLFCSRANEHWTVPSGILPADLDNLDSNLPIIREKLRRSPHLFFDCESVTGSGLRALFLVPIGGKPDEEKYHACFEAVRQHVLSLCGVEIDPACKDPARLSFVSADRNSRLNLEAAPIALLPAAPKQKARTSGRTQYREGPSKEQIREMLAVIPKRPHYHDWIKLCAAVGDGRPEDEAVELLKEWSEEEEPGEYAKKLASGFSEIHTGTLFHIARQHGWKTAPKVTVEDEPTEEIDDRITSLTSFDVSPYPAPLSQAAFHGLAGEFVERVFPSTEADRAALLFTFLVTFGNVIGRTAYAIADGARHYCNLNAVLVGPTGKARKGSARWHTNRLFSCVDEEWIEGCLASGLSTGEGLIAAIQDAVTKTVKNKKSGKEETKTIEPGKKDKRLLVIQTEFATALRVMEREGNILSSVIRAAWDCEPKLRTLTKNSPTCVTNPHISIMAHITAEELRPGLSETEAANGFGNRFLWVPVKRSKELPEGGELPAISDLIEPLQNALQSAKERKEPLKRDDAAREFWASIYHDLSAEQPGLFGAITARSEAQCLRLSNIYALLDCAPLVGVEHLEAALAAWRYCEDGARWSFRAGTGNKNADRVLAALLATGGKGLTKWQITSNVFSRNATKHEIDESLRLLHSRGLAFRKMEGTATRPAERWFYQSQSYEVYEESRPGDDGMRDTSYSSYPEPSEIVNPLPDTSYSSSPVTSEKSNSAEADTEASKQVLGDLKL